MTQKTERYAILLSRYFEDKGSLDMKELTLREIELWNEFKITLPPNKRSSNDYRLYRNEFEFDIGGNDGAMRNRFTLLSLGEVADAIWDRLITKRMTVSAAVRIVDEAKRFARKHHKELWETLPLALHAYEELKHTAVYEGVPVRRGKFSIRPPQEVKTVPAQSPTAPSIKVKTVDLDGEFWARISKDLHSLILSKLDANHILNGEATMARFTTELKILVSDVRDKLRRQYAGQERSRKANRLPQYKIQAACEYLMVPYPPADTPVNLTLAYRRRKELLIQYHPDPNESKGDSPEKSVAKRLLFERTMDAYETLETYNSQLPTGNNGEI